jgi:hypothetical protein
MDFIYALRLLPPLFAFPLRTGLLIRASINQA